MNMADHERVYSRPAGPVDPVQAAVDALLAQNVTPHLQPGTGKRPGWHCELYSRRAGDEHYHSPHGHGPTIVAAIEEAKRLYNQRIDGGPQL